MGYCLLGGSFFIFYCEKWAQIMFEKGTTIFDYKLWPPEKKLLWWNSVLLHEIHKVFKFKNSQYWSKEEQWRLPSRYREPLSMIQSAWKVSIQSRTFRGRIVQTVYNITTFFLEQQLTNASRRHHIYDSLCGTLIHKNIFYPENENRPLTTQECSGESICVSEHEVFKKVQWIINTIELKRNGGKISREPYLTFILPLRDTKN